MQEVQAISGIPAAEKPRKSGMRTFMIIWLGQLISLIGSGLTRFALGVWIYDQTGEAMPFALIALSGTLPNLLLSPLAGAVADRWDRRKLMILSDSGAAVATIFIAAMVFTGRLELWHIYLSAAFSSAFGAFQRPAYMASVTMLVDKKDFGRASGLMQSGQAVSSLLSPVLAGVLLLTLGLKTVVIIDLATYLFAVGSLLLVAIPRPKQTESGAEGKGSIWKESIYGWNYIRVRVGLLSMLLYFALANFLFSSIGILTAPLILSFAGPATLGVLQAVLGGGMLVGSLIMSAWGGPPRKMHGVYGFIALAGLGFAIVGLRPVPWVVGLGGFLALLSVPLAAGCSQVIWQSKVAADVQGRVFAIRGMIATAISPLAMLMSGILSDTLFEPLMAEGGALAPIVGPIIGTGQGRGIGLLFVVSGLTLLVVTAVAYLFPRMRLVEDELPDAVASN